MARPMPELAPVTTLTVDIIKESTVPDFRLSRRWRGELAVLDFVFSDDAVPNDESCEHPPANAMITIILRAYADIRFCWAAHREVSMIRALIVGVILFLVLTFPATFLLMLFVGNIGKHLSYWGTLPLGVLVSVLIGAAGSVIVNAVAGP